VITSPWETSTAANYVKSWASEIDNSLGDEKPCESELQDNNNYRYPERISMQDGRM